MSTKLPSMQFYPGDWMKDPALRAVSSASRGLWIDMLCLMWESARRGFLVHSTGRPVTTEQLARMTGSSVDETSEMLKELEDCGVVSRNKDGILYSRRMERDERKRLKCVEAGKKGGNPALKGEVKGRVKGKVKGESNRKPTPSSSSSSSPSGKSSEEANASSVAPASTESEAVFIRIPTNKFNTEQEEFHVTEQMIEEFEQLYPAVDVRQQLRSIRAWNISNPAQRKTTGGMTRHINTWLSKEQNNATRGTRPHRNNPRSQQVHQPDQADYERLARERGIIE